MRLTVFVAFLAMALDVNAQNVIEWSPMYKLVLADFQNAGTDLANKEGSTFQTSTHIEFGFMMSNAEFMMTKNWNSKVKASFTRNQSFIVAPDEAYAQHVVDLCQADFDLAELYARKLRKELFENKKAFSNMDFARPSYDKIQAEFGERRAALSKETNVGVKSDILKQRQEEILNEISTLSDFCKECKPPKKRK
jgi:hypothetical protein